jgi:DNA-3-methyladenine glycosylase
MRPRRLDRDDFNRPTLKVARELVGTYIVRSVGGRRMSAMITETEAYKGPHDAASHAYGGRRTQRVEPLYQNGGTAYVYLVYGMHWLLNFSTAGEGRPEGVLIRAVILENGEEPELVIGPGRVTRRLQIDQQLTGTDVTRSKDLWLEDRGVRMPARRVLTGPRIGIDYAGAYWAARPWRFWIDGRELNAR